MSDAQLIVFFVLFVYAIGVATFAIGWALNHRRAKKRLGRGARPEK